MNDYSPAAVATVEKELKALKPNIEGWEADFGKETMTKGKAYLNMTWSGDAVWAIEEAGKVGVELGYEVPKEGSNVWFDGWVIPKYSHNPKLPPISSTISVRKTWHSLIWRLQDM